MYRTTVRTAQVDVPPSSPLLPPAPSVLLCASLILSLKRLCSLSSIETAISNSKFAVYVLYTCIIFTPNLGFRVAVSVRERKQCRKQRES